VFVHPEMAALFAALLPLLEREMLFYLDQASVPAPLPGAEQYPVRTMFGQQGPMVCGWLRRYEPEAVGALHLFSALVRSPLALAEVCRAAGGGALGQVGRILAESIPG
jgi:hypothetical protein